MDEVRKTIKSDLSEVEKLAQVFQRITGKYIGHSQQEIELLKALGDQESLVKEQIKLGVMNHARGIFQDCYLRITGRKAWDE